MPKYVVTNGKRYFKGKRGNRYDLTNSVVFAEELSFESARKILMDEASLGDDYYIEDVDTFTKFTQQDLIDNEFGTREPETHRWYTSIAERVDTTAKQISAIDLPDRKTLIIDKNSLVRDLSYCDQVLADIEHWIRKHSPPAHIRSKVYGYMAIYERKHEEIKERVRFMDVLIEFRSSKIDFDGMVKALKNERNKPYKPNTPVYGELDALLA